MTSFGPYVVEAELARGAAGIVFRARDPRDPTATAVAIKVLLRRPGQEGRAARRMEREMRVLERLRHPAIVSVRATGEAPNGALWIAMDLVEGRSLQERLDREGPLPVREAASLLLELARALAHAHAEGVLHRDLKPANVLLDRAGRPFLADFGLAKDLGGTLHGQSLSTSGQFLGTPGYWPPEQARGEHGSIGRASDVYGLGALLYAMLTGEPPSGHSDSLIEAMAAVEREPPPPSRLRPDVPAALDAICARCLRRSPAERYESATDVAAALQGWLGARRGRGRVRRRPAPLVAAAAALLLVAAAGVALAVRQATDGAPAPSTETTVADVPSAATRSPLGLAADELARLMAADDRAAVLAFIDALPPELQANEQVTLSRALTCLELGLRGVTGGSRPEGEALLERAVDLGRGSTDPDVQLVGARALSALGRHDEAIAAFTPLLQAPGDLGAPLLHGALTAAERAFPEATRSFFSPPLSEASENLTAARHLNGVVSVPADDAAPRDRARAHVALARALHASQVMVVPDALDTAVGLAPDDPHARLARAERGLALARDLNEVEADLRVVRGQEASLAAEVRARLTLLDGLLEGEQLLAQGQGGRAGEAFHQARSAATAGDAWTLAVLEHARARRALAFGLPAPTANRELTEDELARLDAVIPQLSERTRAEVILDVVEALPAPARAQGAVVTVSAAMRMERARLLAQAGQADEARAERALALELLTPPRAPIALALRGDVHFAEGRWAEAVGEYTRALREQPGLAARVRIGALECARRAFPLDVWASFLVPGPRPGSSADVAPFLRALLPAGEAPSVLRAGILVTIARACHARGDAAGAAEALRLAAVEGPGSPSVRFARAEWLTAAGRLDEATPDLETLDVTGNHPVLLRTAHEVQRLIASGRTAAAVKIVDDALPLIDPQGNVWLIDAVTHLRALRERAAQSGGGGG
jgi:tetratricopeptide (TPR) repeat protein